MNKLSQDERKAVLSQLVEGNSIRSIERITGIHRDTIIRLLVASGERAQAFLDEKMQNVRCRFVQVDEIWTYVGKKQKRVRPEEHGEFGDQYVFVAIDADTKLVPLHLVGKRNEESTQAFITELSNRLRPGRVQLTSDGFGPYRKAVYQAFDEVDYAMLIKDYGEEVKTEKRYSPARLVGITIRPEIGTSILSITSKSYTRPNDFQIRAQPDRGKLAGFFCASASIKRVRPPEKDGPRSISLCVFDALHTLGSTKQLLPRQPHR